MSDSPMPVDAEEPILTKPGQAVDGPIGDGVLPRRNLGTLFAVLVLVLAAGCLLLAWQNLTRRQRPVALAWEGGGQDEAQTHGEVSWQPRLAAGDAGRSIDDTRLSDVRLDRFRGIPRTAAKPLPPAVLPPEDRWMIEFDAGLTIGDYAHQLDALGVELGVLIDAQTLEYATKLSDSQPKARKGTRTDESRLYLTWSRGDLVAADRVLLSNAGIDGSDRVVLHFMPQATQQRMAKLEQAFAQRPLGKIGTTVFGMRKTFRGFELYVKRQLERK